MSYFQPCRTSLLVIAFCFLSACQTQSTNPRPLALTQDPLIQVYFNQNQAQGADYTEPYRQIARTGDDLEQIIVNAIASANSSIEVAIYEFRLPRIAQALVAKKQAGVSVRVIVDNDNRRGFSDYSQDESIWFEERERNRYQEFLALADRDHDDIISTEESANYDALVMLRKADILILDDTADGSKGSGLMHHKFMVIDGQKVIVSSANFTTSGIHGDFANPGSRGNANHLLQVDNAVLATQFLTEFNLMWGDGPNGESDSQFGSQKVPRSPQTVLIGKSQVTVNFSPHSRTMAWEQTSNGLIAQQLAQANQSVDLALFVFSEQMLANRLQEQHRVGVRIRALIDPGFAFQSYSEGLDLLGVALPKKCQYEANNQPWSEAIATVGVPQLAKGDKLHHKFAVIDRQQVITGSHNWSAAANHTNDETLLIIENPVVAAHFIREFERLYGQARLGLPIYVQDKIAVQVRDCPALTTRDANQPKRWTPNDAPINLNTASQSALESLPGIGHSLAQRIIEARQRKPFDSLEDLDAVSGIGPAKLEALADKVTW